jgi:hypothetical protein
VEEERVEANLLKKKRAKNDAQVLRSTTKTKKHKIYLLGDCDLEVFQELF